jgi:hypothetical protein
VPSAKVTPPSASKETRATSPGAPRAVSRKHDRPQPRSNPDSAERLRRAFETLLVGDAQHIVEVGHEAAAIDLHAGGACDAEGRDQVASPEFDGVDARLLCRRIDETLDEIVCLGLAGAAVGVDRRRVGEGARVSRNTAGIAYTPPIALPADTVELPGPPPER